MKKHHYEPLANNVYFEDCEILFVAHWNCFLIFGFPVIFNHEITKTHGPEFQDRVYTYNYKTGIIKLIDIDIPSKKFLNRIVLCCYKDTNICSGYINQHNKHCEQYEEICYGYIRLHDARLLTETFIYNLILKYIKDENESRVLLPAELIHLISDYATICIIHFMNEKGEHWQIDVNKIINRPVIWSENVHTI